MGHTRAFTKSDTKAAGPQEMRSRPTVAEESPEYEPESNGLAGRCVKTVTGVGQDFAQGARAWILGGPGAERRSDLEMVLVGHTACLYNRSQVGLGGRAPWCRVVGNKRPEGQLSSSARRCFS